MKKINKYLSAGSTVSVIAIALIFGITVLNPTITDPGGSPESILPAAAVGWFEFYNNVSYYNETIWNRVIGNGSSPNDIYGPNADTINSTRKYLSWGYQETLVNIFDIVEFLFNITYDEVNKTTMIQSLNIGDEWPGWSISKDIWNFKIDSWELYSTPDYEDVEFPILRYPYNFTDILEEIQILINNSYLGIDYLNATDLIYYMILTRIDFTIPTATYLSNIIQYIQPQNVSLLGNELILSMQEKENYYIHANYRNNSGFLENLSFFDNTSRLFYQQIGWGEPISIPYVSIQGANIPITLSISIIALIGIAFQILKKGRSIRK